MKGYKVFESDWICRGFQYEVGKGYRYEGEIELNKSGFHFYHKPECCLSYWDTTLNLKVAEVEAVGLVKSLHADSVTNEIYIVRELTWNQLANLINQKKDSDYKVKNLGRKNMGQSNLGHSNRGSCNVGTYNIGYHNVSSCNKGDYNTGYWNNGNSNTGISNTGSNNTGNFNLGSNNTGDWNITNRSTGVFCTEEQTIKIFDKDSGLTYEEWSKTTASRILRASINLNEWIEEKDMTDEEKLKYPEHRITGGYLKVYNFKEACKYMWSNLTVGEKQIIMEIPNFDKDKFFLITGIQIID